MSNFSIFFTFHFNKKLNKQSTSFRIWFEKILDQITENPFQGKPLRVDFLREKKFEKFRVYFLIYKKERIVYFINISDKKNQQKIIDSIFLLLKQYKDEINELTNEL
jgi:mRNA-degrading endonuclease RelE of RelBE toxin-antitoxin system